MNMTLVKEVTNATAVTHGGLFHADEVMATVILSKVFGQLEVCRTFKVPAEVSEDVIVYDIGRGKYDHHQTGGNGARENGVPYSSAGLIWQEFGRRLVADTVNPELVWELIDRDLIQGIDAVDNGQMPKVEYPAQAMSVSSIISAFNPAWDSQEDADECFMKALVVAEVVFDNALKNAISKANAHLVVEPIVNKTEGPIMVLDKYIPWQETVLELEKEKAKKILFVIFPSNRVGYNVQCVPDALDSMGQRKPLPEAWRGLAPEELQKVTGIDTATFCHKEGFIGGAGTLEDAVAMAKLAVEA